MGKLISYIHFLGFIPALSIYSAVVPDSDIGFGEFFVSALFSWGFVFSYLISI